MTARRDRKRRGSPQWIRLGELLAARRAELDPAYFDRVAFARDRGINLKLAQDIENNGRENFTPLTLRDVVAPAYAVTYESIIDTLNGGDLVALPGTPPHRPSRDLRSRSRPQEPPPPLTSEPGASPPAPPGFITPELQEKAQPYADAIWRRVHELAGGRAPDPSGDGQPPNPGGAALFGEGTEDQYLWDRAAGHPPLSRTWLVAVSQSRAVPAHGRNTDVGLRRS